MTIYMGISLRVSKYCFGIFIHTLKKKGTTKEHTLDTVYLVYKYTIYAAA